MNHLATTNLIVSSSSLISVIVLLIDGAQARSDSSRVTVGKRQCWIVHGGGAYRRIWGCGVAEAVGGLVQLAVSLVIREN